MQDRPWHHLAVLAIALAILALVASLTGTAAHDALIPMMVGMWAALMLQIAVGCYDRWL